MQKNCNLHLLAVGLILNCNAGLYFLIRRFGGAKQQLSGADLRRKALIRRTDDDFHCAEILAEPFSPATVYI
jgi:hypothetical protein